MGSKLIYETTDGETIDLETAWGTLGARISGADTAQWRRLGKDLAAAYSEPIRRYHGKSHVLAVLAVLGEIAPDPTVAQQLAAFAHDVVYDPTAAGYADEEASAVWAEEHLLEAGVGARLVADCAALTRATAGHQLDQTPGCAEFLDADLAILGSAPIVYDQYALNIRVEYEHLPDDVFRKGRAAVLESFSARDVLFFSEPGQIRFEKAARSNLARELETLRH
ncbi:MAG: putative metal-dependent HD superfamily phosphohydrolase [Verrucomicrobiales bacterium]|jgi:predicted metal-dependent HD superfamily phosphohydrolase